MIAREATEEQWQVRVLHLAALYRWWVYHVPDSRRATEAGFPDLVLIKEPRVLFVELKKRTGRVKPEQRRCLNRLAACGQEVAVWRPTDQPTVIRALGQRAERLGPLPWAQP